MENSGLTPSEQAFFESGGQTAPDAVETTSSEATENESQVTQDSGVEQTQQTQQTEQAQAESAQQTTEQKQDKQDKPEKMVSIHALHQARMENKEMRQKLENMERTFQEFQKRFAPPEPQIPTVDVDPIAHFQARTQQLEQTIQEMNKRLESGDHEQRQREQQSQFARQVYTLESQFKAQTPDYDEATLFLKQGMYNDLLNRGALPDEIPAMIDNQIGAMARQMLQVGMNPAQVAYHMAQSRGFKSKSAQEAEQRQAQEQAQQRAQQQQQNQQKIESINKGQSAAKSLSSTGGQGKGELTLEALAEMDADELDKHWAEIQKLAR
jgi:hypothetical protein